MNMFPLHYNTIHKNLYNTNSDVKDTGRNSQDTITFTRCTRGSPLESGAAVVGAGVRTRGVGTVLKRPTDSGH